MLRSKRREIFARRLKAALQEKDLKLRQIADALKVPLSTVGNWTQGRGMPNRQMLTRLGELLGHPLDYLAGEPTTVPAANAQDAMFQSVERWADRFISPSGLIAESDPMAIVKGADGEELDVPLTEARPGECVVVLLSKDDWMRMKEAYDFLEGEGKKPTQAKILRAALHACQFNSQFSRTYEGLGKRQGTQDV